MKESFDNILQVMSFLLSSVDLPHKKTFIHRCFQSIKTILWFFTMKGIMLDECDQCNEYEVCYQSGVYEPPFGQ